MSWHLHVDDARESRDRENNPRPHAELQPPARVNRSMSDHGAYSIPALRVTQLLPLSGW